MTAYANSTFNAWFEQYRLTGFPNGIDLGGIGKAGVVFQLTSAQLLALQTTAVTLVAPQLATSGVPVPPSGYLLYPISLVAEYVYNTTAYTIGNSDNAFQIEYVGKTTALLSMTVTGVVDQTANTIKKNSATTPGTAIATANCKNLGLEVKLVGTTAALTLGDGTVNLYLEYGIHCLF